MVTDIIMGGIKMYYFEKIFGKGAQTTVLEYLIKKKDEFTYLSGIANDTGLSHSSVARVIKPLIENNIVIERKLGRLIRMFTINKENDTAKLIIKLYDDLSISQRKRENLFRATDAGVIEVVTC